MNENQYPDPQPPLGPAKRKNSTWIYIIIILLLVVTNIILFTLKNKSDNKNNTAMDNYSEQKVANENLQIQYSAALARLDDLSGKNAALDKLLRDKNSEIGGMKANIEKILNDKNASALELVQARSLIRNLNTRIGGYEQQIGKLRTENATLVVERDNAQNEKATLTQRNDELQQKVALAKVLHASNILIIPIDLRRGGNKEKETTRARRVDMLRIQYDIDENRVTEAGIQQIYLRIVDPTGQLLSNAANGSGAFQPSNAGQPILYSLSKDIMLKPNTPVQNLVMDWQQSADYATGDYTIELYNQGFLIGKQTVALR